MQPFEGTLAVEAARHAESLSVCDLHAALRASADDKTPFAALLSPTELRTDVPFCTVRALQRARDLLSSIT